MNGVLLVPSELKHRLRMKVTLEGQATNIRSKLGAILIGNQESGVSRMCIATTWMGLPEFEEDSSGKILWVRVSGVLVNTEPKVYDSCLNECKVEGYEILTPEEATKIVELRRLNVDPKN